MDEELDTNSDWPSCTACRSEMAWISCIYCADRQAPEKPPVCVLCLGHRGMYICLDVGCVGKEAA